VNLKNEKFIWDNIVERVEKVSIPRVHKMWKEDRRIPTMLFSWPSVHLRSSDNKTTITHLVSFVPPREVNLMDSALFFARKTEAYALLLVRREGNEIKIVVESAHGSKSWKIPVERHGDVEVLGKAKAAENADHIGILWRPNVPVG
jgi:hypothetical protein